MTQSVTVNNTLSNVDLITLSAEPLYTNDTISALAMLSDIDTSQTNNLTASYEWHVIDDSAGGVDQLITGVTGNSLYGGHPTHYFGKNDEVYVIVTPYDGLQNGNPLTSDIVTISNSIPSTPVITAEGSLNTPAIVGAEDLICSVDTPAIDDDPEDMVYYTYDWTQPDGSFVAGSLTTTTSDSIPMTDVVGGEGLVR